LPGRLQTAKDQRLFSHPWEETAKNQHSVGNSEDKLYERPLLATSTFAVSGPEKIPKNSFLLYLSIAYMAMNERLIMIRRTGLIRVGSFLQLCIT